MAEKILTEAEVRQIAREEGMIIFEKGILSIKKEVEVVRKLAQENAKTLGKIERLLLGEFGEDSEETLKTKATFAYRYAKRNTDLNIIERAEPALDWFKDMSSLEPGCKETKLESLGKLITFYMNIRWILGIIGVTTIINAIPVIQMIAKWLERLS